MALAAPVTEEVPHCPQCRSAMGGGAVVWIKCGYDSRSGKRLVTEATAQKPAKSILGYGRKDKNKPEDRMAPDGSFLLGLILSTVFALAASLVWIGIAWATGLTIGYIAILIGAGAGLGMHTVAYTNQYPTRVKAFLNWCIPDKLVANSLAKLRRGNLKKAIKRRARRPLAEHELSKLLAKCPRPGG